MRGRAIRVGTTGLLAAVLGLVALGRSADARDGTSSRAAGGDSFLPTPSRALPREPALLAATLARTTTALERSVERWLSAGATTAGAPPRAVELQALLQQRIFRLLGRDERLARATLARLSHRLVPSASAIVAARRALSPLATPVPPGVRVRVGPPLPAGVLLRSYRRAERRFGIPWPVLAAINFVESAFGRVRSASGAGAQGPMQFIPSTWRAYGLGGDVQDPHDAILGAANYLRAAGGTGDIRRALYAYNHSAAYVDAVLLYAGVIGRDRRAYYGFYSWQVFVRTASGDRRLTGPGIG